MFGVVLFGHQVETLYVANNSFHHSETDLIKYMLSRPIIRGKIKKSALSYQNLTFDMCHKYRKGPGFRRFFGEPSIYGD